MLSHDGTVQLVLMNHQEGVHCSSLAEWKQSRKPALSAAHHGLLLTGFDDWTVPIPNPLIEVQMQSFSSRVLQMCIPSHDTFRNNNPSQRKCNFICYYQIVFRHDCKALPGQKKIIADRIQDTLSDVWRAMVNSKLIWPVEDTYMVAFLGGIKDCFQA